MGGRSAVLGAPKFDAQPARGVSRSVRYKDLNYPSRWYSLLAPEMELVAHDFSSTHMWFRDWDARDEWKPRETPLSASVRMEHSRWGAPRIGLPGGVVPVSPLWLRASHAGPTDPLLPPGPP